VVFTGPHRPTWEIYGVLSGDKMRPFGGGGVRGRGTGKHTKGAIEKPTNVSIKTRESTQNVQ